MYRSSLVHSDLLDDSHNYPCANLPVLTFTVPQIAFAVLYGFFCGSSISLTPAVAARLYGPGRLAGLSGLLLLFNVPGELVRSFKKSPDIDKWLFIGNGGGAPTSGAILRATGNNWRIIAVLNGGCQVAGAMCILYGEIWLPVYHLISVAHVLRKPFLFPLYSPFQAWT